MSKDPAFLFYTKDFQSGTIDMSCTEVGAYIRLLMHQHQHGYIPSDIERLMRITGIFKEDEFMEIWEMVKHKFNHLVSQNSNHLVNKRLSDEMIQRSKAKPKKIASAVFAGLISSNNLNIKVVKELKKSFNISEFIDFEEEEIKEKIKEWFYKMVNQMVNNLANANANANANEDKDEDKGGMGEKNEPTKKKTKVKSINLKLNNKIDLIYPFNSNEFMEIWDGWKRYKIKEFGFKYKSVESEQAALVKLSEYSEGIENVAIELIKTSMSNGWKGFWPIENKNNGDNKNRRTATGGSVSTKAAFTKIDQMYSGNGTG